MTTLPATTTLVYLRGTFGTFVLRSRGAFDVQAWTVTRARAFRVLGVTQVTYEVIV